MWLLTYLYLLAVGLSAAATRLNYFIPDVGYWIVAGSVDAHAPDTARTVEAALDKVHRCGGVAFSDVSSKFNGFAPGLVVIVLGPYRSVGEAEAAAEKVRPCVPDAYVKFSVY